MLNTRNTRIALLVLLLACVASPRLPAQSRRPGNVQKTSRVVPTEPELTKEQQRRKLAQDIVENIFQDARSVLNPVIRTRIRTLSADAYWHFRPQTARQILRDEFSALKSLDSAESASQFWIEKDRLLFVRLIESRKSIKNPDAPPRLLDVTFEGYRPLGKGWIETEVVIKVDGKEVQRERYADIKADVELPPDLYDTKTYRKPGWIKGQ